MLLFWLLLRIKDILVIFENTPLKLIFLTFYGNFILALLTYHDMIKTFQERWKGLHYFSSMKYPFKIEHFEADYMVLMCLAQNFTFWKIRKKFGYFFGSFEKTLVDFCKKSGNTACLY
jgi:hypothetical protein